MAALLGGTPISTGHVVQRQISRIFLLKTRTILLHLIYRFMGYIFDTVVFIERFAAGRIAFVIGRP